MRNTMMKRMMRIWTTEVRMEVGCGHYGGNVVTPVSVVHPPVGAGVGGGAPGKGEGETPPPLTRRTLHTSFRSVAHFPCLAFQIVNILRLIWKHEVMTDQIDT